MPSTAGREVQQRVTILLPDQPLLDTADTEVADGLVERIEMIIIMIIIDIGIGI
jgi:hypothetical protein